MNTRKMFISRGSSRSSILPAKQEKKKKTTKNTRVKEKKKYGKS